MYCVGCGSKIDEGHRFCPSCGTAAAAPADAAAAASGPAAPAPAASAGGGAPVKDNVGSPMGAEAPRIKEKICFEGDGELIVKKIEHRGAGRKIASWLAGGPVGYLAFGRDKTQRAKAKGTLAVTQEALYCAGNEYRFDKILSIARIGSVRKSVLVNFEKDVTGQRYDIKLEIRTKEMDRLFAALESARMSKIGF